jgi:hypothetical protein
LPPAATWAQDAALTLTKAAAITAVNSLLFIAVFPSYWSLRFVCERAFRSIPQAVLVISRQELVRRIYRNNRCNQQAHSNRLADQCCTSPGDN